MNIEQIVSEWKNPFGGVNSMTSDTSQVPSNPAGRLIIGDNEMKSLHGGEEEAPSWACSSAICTITVTITLSCLSCEVSACAEEGTCEVLTLGCC